MNEAISLKDARLKTKSQLL